MNHAIARDALSTAACADRLRGGWRGVWQQPRTPVNRVHRASSAPLIAVSFQAHFKYERQQVGVICPFPPNSIKLIIRPGSGGGGIGVALEIRQRSNTQTALGRDDRLYADYRPHLRTSTGASSRRFFRLARLNILDYVERGRRC